MSESGGGDEAPVRLSRRRLIAFGGVVAGAVGLAVTGFTRAIRDQRRSRSSQAQVPSGLDLASVLAVPHVLFRDTQLGATFSKVAAVPLANPGGPRAISTVDAERLYARAGTTICMQADRGLATTYKAQILDAALRPVQSMGVNGAPKPTRVSSDGTIAAWTVLVVGTGCTDMTMEAETTVEDLHSRHSYGTIEKTFRVLVDDRPMTAAVINVWDVTFENVPRPTRFYVTVSDNTASKTWLAEGDLATKTITAFHPGGQTPSLSPDNRTLVFVERQGSSQSFRLRGLDLRTREEWYLPDTRSVHDQVEWLDNEHVLYGLAREGSATADVWLSPLRGGQPRLYIEHADSPAVVDS
jgi:hypothetical protein